MAIAGFKKIDSDRYDMRGAPYCIIKVDGKWDAYTVDAAGDPNDAIHIGATQGRAAKSAFEHKACAPVSPTPAPNTPNTG